MPIEVNRMITLGNDQKFIVIDKVTKHGRDYFYIAEVNENEDAIKENYKIVYSELIDNQTYITEEQDEEVLKEILPLFAEHVTD